MPFIFVEELQDGQEEAQVIEQSVHNEILRQLEDAREQRDQAIERAEIAEKGWRESKEKYANTFLTTPSKIVDNSMPRKITAQSVSELFNPKREG